MYLAKKKYRPRIQGLKQIQALNSQLDNMRELAQELRADRDAALLQVIAVKQSMEKLSVEIKVRVESLSLYWYGMLGRFVIHGGSLKIRD